MDDVDGQSRPYVELAFDHDLSAARQARRALAPLLVDPEDPIADDVRLAASEMVTNVVMHTGDGGVMRAHDPDPAVPLRLEVEDHDDRIPQSPLLTSEHGGRGLSIINAVSDAWGVIRRSGGKVMWAEFDRQQRRARSDPGAGRDEHGEDPLQR